MPKQTTLIPEKETPDQEQRAVAVRSNGAANQNTLRNIGLIIGREYKNRITQRSFIISTLIILVLLVIGVCVPTFIQYFTSKSNTQTKMVVINNANTVAGLRGEALTHYIETNLNGAVASSTTGVNTPGAGKPHFVISAGTSDSADALQKKVKNSSLDILLVIDRSATHDLHFTYYSDADSASDANLSQVQAMAGQLNFLDKASRLGLTPTQTSSLFVQPGFTVMSTLQNQDHRSESERLAGYILAYIGVILIFMSVFLYGMGVAVGVAEEKGSRIMEILINAATPFQLMVGKIIGIGAAGLSQMVLFVLVGIGALLLQTPLQAVLIGSSSNGLNLDITGASISLLLLLLLYFILGFLLYATLFAALGALVRRQDEVQNAVAPITWLFMIGYVTSFVGISSPDATWVRVLSYIPFWTPTVMLMRIGSGRVVWWDILLSVVLMMVAIFACAVISARIYRFGVLMYGQKPKLGQLIKLVRTK